MNYFGLKGKKILMFSPFGTCKHYTDAICSELIKRGASVHLYDERPSQKSWVKIYMTLFKKIAPKLFTDYIKQIIKENENFAPDYIFIIRGQGFDCNILNLLKLHYQSSKFVLFQWDPLNGKKIPEILKLYDKAFSFDIEDVKSNPEFIFRPTFFLSEYESMSHPIDSKYDIIFVGTIYNNRWPALKNIQSYFEKNGIVSYMHLYMASWTLYIWDFIIKGLFVSPCKMKFHMMSYKDNVQLVSKSKAILDIVYSKQSGLSMRAFEALASKRKYITNNSHIKEYDFYNEANILVIDKDNPNIPKEFLQSPFQKIDSNIVYKYSIPGFVDEIFKDI